MFEYNVVKIALLFFICSGIFNLLAGTYLAFSKRRTAEPTKLQASWSKALLRGISRELFGLVAYGVFRRAIFEPWHIFIVLMPLSFVTEILIARIVNRPFFPIENH